MHGAQRHVQGSAARSASAAASFTRASQFARARARRTPLAPQCRAHRARQARVRGAMAAGQLRR
eukprot:2694705-Pyramimonas_sp.AAC.1